MTKMNLQASAQGIADAFKSLRTLCRNWHVFVVWPLAALLICGISWSVLLAGLDRDRREAERDGIAKAVILSRGYADQVARTMDAVDQSLLHVRYEWELSKGTLQLETMGEKGLFPPSKLSYAAITDRDGNVRTGTLPDAGKTNSKDRPYFRAQITSAGDQLFIGHPTIGKASRRNVLQFSRRLVNASGEFDGVVFIAVAPDYFTASYDAATLGQDGYLAIVGEDHIVRVTRIGQTVYKPDAQALTVVPRFTVPGGSALLEGSTWFSDRRNRFVGWQSVPGYALVAVAGLDEQATLAPYWSARAGATRRALLATLAFAAVTLTGMGLMLRLSWRKQQAQLTQATYRMATEGSNEGFFILEGLTGAAGQIDDFEVVDCNRQGAAVCRQRRETLIGRRFSSLWQGNTLKRIMDPLLDAMKTGAFDGELEFRSWEAGKLQWWHLRAVRSESRLAITLRDISDSKAHVEELERRSNQDVLTGLPNRHWLQRYLPQAIARAAENDVGLALLFIDLDGFKAVNDTMGHAAGDELLRYAAQRLRDAVRPHDYVVRIGGDEFVVILENSVLPADAAQVATRVLAAFKPKFKLLQGTQSIGTSIGISVFPRDGNDATTLLQNADVAMYSVKTSGKGNYRFYALEFFEALRARLERESELRRAIENDQFIMYYQPRVDISTGATTSIEALVRWTHPSRGLVEPREFIPLAEETGLILGVGALVIEKVCAQLAQWARSGQELVPVSVNVSSRQFNETDIFGIFSEAIARYGLNPQLLEIELTESSMMGSGSEICQSLAAIRELGIKLLVDDFGTGYSSLAQLQMLDFDVLKVDQAFTARIEQTEEGKIFFTAIITMAHALGMRVVAEGVETENQITILRSMRCDEIQGFYISEPLPPADTQPILPRWIFPESA
ncbi:MAG: EAL domain-containing protein [Telluria sp.]|nr:EAL domain-containing protein [Telluria sp.]